MPDPVPRSPWPRIAAALALAQVVAAVPFDRWSSVPPPVGGEPSPLVPPAPWAAAWGVLLVLSLVWAADGLLRRPDAATGPLAVALSATFGGFVVWQLVLAQGSAAALPAFLLALAGLATAAVRLRAHRATLARRPAASRVLTTALVGGYAGWATAAFWTDVAAAAQRVTGPLDGAAARAWLLLLLAAATASAVLGLVLLNGSWACAATTTVAFTGMAAGCAAQGQSVVALTVLDAIAVVVVATMLVRARPAPPPRRLAASAGRAS